MDEKTALKERFKPLNDRRKKKDDYDELPSTMSDEGTARDEKYTVS